MEKVWVKSSQLLEEAKYFTRKNKQQTTPWALKKSPAANFCWET